MEREKERLMESRGKRGSQNPRKGGKATAMRYTTSRHEERSQKDACLYERGRKGGREGDIKNRASVCVFGARAPGGQMQGLSRSPQSDLTCVHMLVSWFFLVVCFSLPQSISGPEAAQPSVGRT